MRRLKQKRQKHEPRRYAPGTKRSGCVLLILVVLVVVIIVVASTRSKKSASNDNNDNDNHRWERHHYYRRTYNHNTFQPDHDLTAWVKTVNSDLAVCIASTDDVEIALGDSWVVTDCLRLRDGIDRSEERRSGVFHDKQQRHLESRER